MSQVARKSANCATTAGASSAPTRLSLRNSTVKQRKGSQIKQIKRIPKLSALQRRVAAKVAINQMPQDNLKTNNPFQDALMRDDESQNLDYTCKRSSPRYSNQEQPSSRADATIRRQFVATMASGVLVASSTRAVDCMEQANVNNTTSDSNSTKRLKCIDEARNVNQEDAAAKLTTAPEACSKGFKASSGEDNKQEPPSPSESPRRARLPVHRHKLIHLAERNPTSIDLFNKHMPWFGIDVGGTLVKVVFFDPKDASNEELVTLKRIRRYLKSSKPYGTSGKRDAHLEMPNCVINKRVGTLHFIRFATNRMPSFLSMAKTKRFTETIHTVCATGGGAYKFEEEIKTNLGITLHKTDELDSIIYGIHYIDKYNSDRECYFLEDPLDDEKCVKVPYDFSRPYPYLVVNIGSGVSILAVYSSTSYSRISGSSIGGGTFLGLCSLLTQCKTFDEAIKLAKAGSSAKLDKLVKDIYGGDYPKFNLSGDTVASSFGHMNIIGKTNEVKREDLARGLLEMVTINIGLIARICAEKEDIDRVVFIGNFLRVNQLSMKLLSYAVNYWSKGSMKALFLEHEGYFGAVGCFVESTQGCYH